LALEHYRKSLTLREALGDKAGIAGVLLLIGFSYSAQGKFDLALEHYQKSLAIREMLGDKAAIAAAQNSVGNAHRFQRNYGPALEAYQKALALYETLGDKVAVATTQTYVGDVYNSQSNYSAAAVAYQKSLALAETLGNKTMAADLSLKIGYLYQTQNNYSVALVYHQKSLALSEAANNKPNMAQAWHAICGDQGMVNNVKAAMESCQKSLALKEALGDKQGMAATHNLIAWINHHAGDYKTALEYYHKVIAQTEAAGNWSTLAAALADSGEAYETSGDQARALEHFQKAAAQFEAHGAEEGLARTLYEIGRISLLRGQLAEAVRAAERATGLARKTNSYEALWRARTLAGQTLQALDQLPAARAAFEEAVMTIERMRDQLAGGEHERIRYLTTRLIPWHRLVEILVAQGDASAALNYAESAKARGLLDVMQNGHAVVTDAMTAQEQEQEQKINAELASLNGQILHASQRPATDQALLEQLRERQQQTRSEREAFYNSLYATHRELRELRGKAQPLKLEEVARFLPDSTSVLLNYLVADDKTFLFVLTRSGPRGEIKVRAYTINITAAALAEKASSFRQLLAKRSFDFQPAARELYDLLLKPAAAQLLGKRLLIISPDAGLWELPFQVLRPAPNRYLIENHAIAYTPSLSVLRETVKLRKERARNKADARLILAMGNPTLGRETMARAKSVLMSENLNPLPEAEEQVTALKQIYGSSQSLVLTGAEAREEVFKAEAPKYRILHLATHGVLNDSSGIYSHLLLAQSEDGGKEDGLLEAWELIRMKLSAELVVLSACETARGRWGAGEGIVGMTGMLFVAGCPTIVVSQWKVEAASTAKLMVDFHRQFKLGLTRLQSAPGTAQSLQAAALKMLRSGQYRHPFYWAGFVVMGDGF
jgi:CHAT domain-containing protein